MLRRLRIQAVAVSALVAVTSAAAVSSSQAAAGYPSMNGASADAAPIIAATQVPPGTYLIKNDAAPFNYCLQRDPRFDLSQGPLVGMVPCNGSAFQLWDLSLAEFGPASIVRNRAGGCLDADNRGGRPTFVVHVIPCNTEDNPNQRWLFNNSFENPPLRVCSEAFCGFRNTLYLDNSQDSAGGFGQRVNLWHPDRPTKGDFDSMVFRLCNLSEGC